MNEEGKNGGEGKDRVVCAPVINWLGEIMVEEKDMYGGD